MCAVSLDLERTSESDSVSERAIPESKLASTLEAYLTFHSPHPPCSFTDANLCTVPPRSTGPQPGSIISSGLRQSCPPSALQRNSVRQEWQFSATCLIFCRRANFHTVVGIDEKGTCRYCAHT